jgi:hypothetical protein
MALANLKLGEIRYRKLRVLPPVGKQTRYPALTLTVIHAEERGTPKNRKKIDRRSSGSRSPEHDCKKSQTCRRSSYLAAGRHSRLPGGEIRRAEIRST